ncbi:ABC transporter ATP-binding protein [Streptosporangium sp. NPDC006930]|uniref:ABC transporter ATP-binding protein n=1 Tax=unclassified Streptosporangium TaxID=2632669 RepID=UPI0034416D61
MFGYPRRRPADDPPPPSRSGAPLLEIDGLSVGYERAGAYTPVLENVGLTVQDGEFVCVVGASGCGKTTLLKTIDGLIAPAAGEVRVSGRPPDPRRGDMAVVFQQDSLYPWRTVLANVRFGLDLRGSRSAATDARSRECIELVGLRGFEDHYPHELSGGMRQRVNLARALAVDPTVLLMDEPFAALDAQTREVMQTELLDIWTRHRKTVVFITHQLDEAVLLADRVIVMAAHPGRVREEILIDIPRPRDLHTKRGEKFTRYVDHIWKLIENEVRSSLIPGTTASGRDGT